MNEFLEFQRLPPAEQDRRTREGTLRAAAQLGLSVEALERLCNPPPLPRPKPVQTPRCPTCGRPAQGYRRYKGI